MKFRPLRLALAACGVPLVSLPLLVRGDVLVGTNGERFIGTVIEETATNVVFQSELGGRLTLAKMQIRELQLAPPVGSKNPTPSIDTTNISAAQSGTNLLSWKPPGIGHDNADWVELKSGEWLRGQLKYIQNKQVEFDSDEMDEQTLKLKNVRSVYTAHPMYTQFENRQPVLGMVVVSNEAVNVTGSNSLALNRDQLIGITPSGGRTGIRDWTGSATLGISLQSGNYHQSTASAAVELARRTPNTTLLLNYLGNYSEANGVQSANNDRFNGTYDIRLNKDWFVRPADFECYHDLLANVSYRLTAGVGAGYYIFDRPGLEWTVAAGPSYQYTQFGTVESGQSDKTATPAGMLETRFKADLTQRLTFIETWQSIFTSKEAGQYTHHSVSTLEFEIKRHLELTPATDAQRQMLAQALQLTGDLLQFRWLLIEQAQNALPKPLLIVLLFWLTMLHTSFGLFAPRNATVIIALLACALSVSAAIFLILEMSHPMSGFIKVSSAPMLKALEHLEQ